MGSKQDLEYNRNLLIRLTDEEAEILERLRKDRNLSFSELVREALGERDGEPHLV